MTVVDCGQSLVSYTWWVGLGTVLYLGVLAASPSWAAFLESPAPAAVVSGIGFIGGWKCDASNITVTTDGGEHISVAMGQPRADTRPICGTTDNGFIQQINWALVGDGEHEAVAYDNGVEFDRATFTVGTTGEEFLKGAMRRQLLENFPAPGETTILEWNESTQHFEIRGVLDSPMGGGYDLSYWRQMSIGLFEGTYQTARFLYDEEPDLDTCRAGRLTQAAKGRALEAMNQIRALHGLEPVQYSLRYDNQVQQASLIQAAAGYPGHFPEPSAQCYTPAGAEGSGSSNLSGGARDIDPARDMIGWANDARNRSLIAAVGHRRGLLNAFSTYMSYGQVHGYAAQKVFGFDDEEPITPHITVDYVAFPYETYPFHLVGEGTPWSFSVIEDKRSIWGNLYPYFENASINVIRTSDETSLVITNRYTDSEGFGVPNLLSWQVEGWEYDTLYEVELRNVTLRSGETRSYSYPVFIDRASIEY